MSAGLYVRIGERRPVLPILTAILSIGAPFLLSLALVILALNTGR